MIFNFFTYFIRSFYLFPVCLLLLLPGCKKPYEQFKRPLNTTFRQKQKLMRTLKRKNLFKRIKDMNLEEALEAKQYYEDLGREDMVLQLIPHIISISKDVHLTARLQLELADLHLSSGNLEQAGKLYTDFVSFYPGDANIKKARYHLLLATFWTALEPDRDQALTNTSVELAKKYLQDFPQDEEYTPKVHEIIKACYQALLEGELSLMKFYLNKFTYEHKPTAIEAARLRLTHIKDAYLPILALYDERGKNILETMEPIEKLATMDDLALVREQADLIMKQVALAEMLLVSPLQKYKVHPRDTF